MAKRTCTINDCGRVVHGHGFCTRHYRNFTLYGDAEYQRPWSTVCEFDGCDNLTRSHRVEWCEMHYYRIRRHGRPDAVSTPSGRALTTNGYVLVFLPEHPLSRRRARQAGWVLEHRVVLYESIGPNDHPCHWCGLVVSWDLSYPKDRNALVVDHLDGVHDRNIAGNLVPSCNPCNSARGHSQPQPVTVTLR